MQSYEGHESRSQLRRGSKRRELALYAVYSKIMNCPYHVRVFSIPLISPYCSTMSMFRHRHALQLLKHQKLSSRLPYHQPPTLASCFHSQPGSQLRVRGRYGRPRTRSNSVLYIYFTAVLSISLAPILLIPDLWTALDASFLLEEQYDAATNTTLTTHSTSSRINYEEVKGTCSRIADI